jgi:glycerophosphoryl diester phosphodiesterase
MRILVAVLIGVGCGSPSHEPMPTTNPPRPRVVAHRGASFEAPENTLAAFRRAWALGAEACELDVRLTQDGEVVVFHDADTLRIGGRDRPVAEQTLAELRELDVGGYKHIKYAHERIPTLADALATIPAGRTMHVEIKTGPETAAAIGKVIRDARPTSVAIVLQGYNPDALAALAQAAPEAPAFWDVDPPHDDHGPQPYPLSIVAEAKRRGFPGLALDYRGVTDELLAAAKDAGILVDVWTLNDAGLLTQWGGRDVRWMETDRPELAP